MIINFILDNFWLLLLITILLYTDKSTRVGTILIVLVKFVFPESSLLIGFLTLGTLVAYILNNPAYEKKFVNIQNKVDKNRIDPDME